MFGSVGLPHGVCFLWDPSLLWLHVVSDSLIALAYFLIPVALVRILRKRSDIPFNGVFFCFAAFVVACGLTHVMEVVTLWHPVYWVSGILKAVTAAVSIATLVVLVRISPAILSLPTEGRLRETAAQLNSLLESTTVCVLAVDSTWKLHYMNRNAKEVLAVRRDVLGMTLWEAFPEMVPEDQAFLRKVMATRQGGSHESFYPLLDLTTTVQAHPWEHGGIAVFFTNISAQKRLERELETANRMAASVLANTNISIYAVDGSWTVRYINENAKRTLGDRGDMLGKNLWEAFPDLEPEASAHLREAMASRVPVTFESYYGPLDLWTNVKVHPWEESGITVYFSDISERKRAERDLARTNQRLASVLDNTSVGVYAVDRDWKFTYVNENARVMLKEMGDVMGKDLRIAFPDQRATTRAKLEQVMATRQPVAFESYYPTLDLSTNISAHPLDDGGITIYFSDISAQRRLERELESERAQRQQRLEVLARLSSGLAHEIKNPLAIIHARASDLAEMAEEGEVGRAEIGKTCASIVQTSDRAIRILRGVAAMARVGTHDPMRPAGVAAMVSQAIELVEGRYKVAGIRLETEVPEGLPMLECRDVQISQILVNLLNNAFDAVENDARSERWVRLVVSVQPGTEHEDRIDRLQISVIDGGPGVAPEHRERLMQTFFTTKSMGAGIGIGLSVSRTIAEDHGGQLELRERDGHTCFRLTLPVKAGRPEEIAA
jgi:PAS domain S-box-containing protein